MNEFEQTLNKKRLKTNTLKAIKEEDEHISLNNEIQKQNTAKIQPKQNLSKKIISP